MEFDSWAELSSPIQLIYFIPWLICINKIILCHCWGDDIVMLFWYFDTTIKSLADTMTQGWLFRCEDDDGWDSIREKWSSWENQHHCWKQNGEMMILYLKFLDIYILKILASLLFCILDLFFALHISGLTRLVVACEEVCFTS